jgi:cation diffusion facilitator CzcD-associated flavoprotein CzcO
MRSTLLDWPEGTPDYITHEQVEQYIQDLAVRTGVQDRVQYDTRVESVRKNSNAASASGWTIRTKTLRRATGDEGASGYELVSREWLFDAVVAASGRYHEPRIPDLPGLKDWKQRFPDNVFHSKRYRSPELFRGKMVFLVGGGVSALDLAKEIVDVARETYQSSRRGKYDLPGSMFAAGVKRVGSVDRFVPGEGHEGAGARGSIILSDGEVIPGIDIVVLCTGYITSYPFLGDLQNPAVSKEEADDEVVITSDGCTTHNLHRDLFYIPDPSLVFVGVPYHASAFSLFDFQGRVLARVFAD